MRGGASILLLSLALAGCPAKDKEQAEREAPAATTPAARAEPPAKEQARSKVPRPPPLPGPKGEALQGVTLKRITALPLDKTLSLGALAGTLAVPEWARPGEDLPSIRDDDLLTGWTCQAADGQPCAVGVRLAQAAEVAAIRLFVGRAASREAFNSAPRPRLVRLHTDSGWIEARLESWWDFQHLVLDPPLRTRSLALEVRDTHGGDGPVHLAELEVLGRGGKLRPPLAVTPANLVAHAPAGFWSGGSETAGPRAGASWLEQLDAQGKVQRRLLRGTHVSGQAGDRLLLVSRFASASCPGAYLVVGTRYTLLDTHRRVMYGVRLPANSLLPPARHEKGRGFAAGGYDLPLDRYRASALLWEEGKVRQVRSDHPDHVAAQKALARLGFPAPARYPRPPPAGCKRLTDRKLLRPLRLGESKAARWLQCPAGDGKTVVFFSDICGFGHDLAVLSADGKVLDRRPGKGEMAAVQVRPLPGGRLLIAIERNAGDTGDLYTVTPEGKFRLLQKNTLLSPGEPSDCRCSA